MRSSAGSARSDGPDLSAIVLAFGVGFSYQLGLDEVDRSGAQRSVEDVTTGAARGSSISFTGGRIRTQEKSIWSGDPLGEDTRGLMDGDGSPESSLLSRNGTRPEVPSGLFTPGGRICASVQPFPTPIPLERFLKRGDAPAFAAAGANHSVLLTRDGKLFRWGVEDGGIFRVPTAVCTHIPLPCVQVCCGRKHTVALMQGGFVVTWGTGYFGQLGHGDNISYRHPKLLRRLDPQRLGERVTQIACGGYHSAVVTDAGKVFAWGFNRYGQCGNGSKDNTVGEPALVDLSEVRPGGLGKNPKVICGRHHSALVAGWGGLYTWGACSFGKLGLSDPEKTVCAPQEVTFFADKPLLQAAAGDFHMVALSRQREVFSWGYGAEGQGGHGNLLHMRTPRRVNALQDIPIVQVACGPWWSMAVTVDGYCYSWGCADGGWTGLALTKGLSVVDPGPANDRAVETESFDSCHNVHVPELVYSLAPFRVLQVGCGGGHSLVVATPRAPTSIPSVAKASSTGVPRSTTYSSSSRSSSETGGASYSSKSAMASSTASTATVSSFSSSASTSSSLQRAAAEAPGTTASIGAVPPSGGTVTGTLSGWTSTSGSGWESGSHGEGCAGATAVPSADTCVGLSASSGDGRTAPKRGSMSTTRAASKSVAGFCSMSEEAIVGGGRSSCVPCGGGSGLASAAVDSGRFGKGLAALAAAAASSSSMPPRERSRDSAKDGTRRVGRAGLVGSAAGVTASPPVVMADNERSSPPPKTLRDGNRRQFGVDNMSDCASHERKNSSNGKRIGVNGASPSNYRGVQNPDSTEGRKRKQNSGKGSSPSFPPPSGPGGETGSLRATVGAERTDTSSLSSSLTSGVGGEIPAPGGSNDERRGALSASHGQRDTGERVSAQEPVDSCAAEGAREPSRMPLAEGEELTGPEYVAKVFSYCRHGRLEQVKAALDGGFDVCAQRDENGNTLLHCAAQNGLRCMCKAVLHGGKGSSLNLKNSRGNTALHYAFAFGFHQLGKYLAMNGADDTLVNDQGLTCYEGLDRQDLDVL